MLKKIRNLITDLRSPIRTDVVTVHGVSMNFTGTATERALINTWEEELLEIIDKYSPEQFIDIGAYIGMYSIYAQKRCDCSRIILVEPNPVNAAVILKNLNANGMLNTSGCIPVIGAVGLEGLIGFADSKRDKLLDNSTTGQIDISDNCTFYIHCVDINPLISASLPTLIKIDVEGAELEALKQIDLSVNIKALYVEVFTDTEQAVCSLMQKKGYKLDISYQRAVNRKDCLFIKDGE